MENKWMVIEYKRMYPAIHKDGKYDGCILNEQDARYVVQACNEYPELLKRVAELEEENRKLKGISA